MAECGSGKLVINDMLPGGHVFHTDLETRFLYLRDGHTQWLLATMDLSYIWRSTSRRWREAVSEATGIPVEAIWVHTPQLHSSSTALEADGFIEELIERSIPVVRNTIDSAEEAEMAYAIADCGTRFNYRREQYVRELGAVTVWGGQLEKEDGLPPFSNDPDVMLLSGWRPPVQAFNERIYFDRPVDSQAVLIVFRSKATGRVIGSFSRFTGHPDVANGAKYFLKEKHQYRQHHDWPGVVRETIDARLGGTGVCVNGPCGDVGMRFPLPHSREQADAEVRRLGEGIASACISRLEEKKFGWRDLRLGPVASRFVDVPLKETMPPSRSETPSPEEHQELLRPMQERFARAQAENLPPAQVKRLLDDLHHYSCLPKFVFNWANLSDDELKSRRMRMELVAARINDLVVCGLPGESMTDTNAWLKAQTIGSRLVCVDDVNGHCSYQTTPDQFDQGGYSYWGGCISREATPITRLAATELVREVAGEEAF